MMLKEQLLKRLVGFAVTLMMISVSFGVMIGNDKVEALTPDDILMFTDSFDDDSKIDYFKSTNVNINTQEGWITTQTDSTVVSEEIPIGSDRMWSVIFISLSLHDGSVDIQILDGCTLDPLLSTNITSGGEYGLNYLGSDFDISPYAHPTIRIKVEMSNSGSLGPRIHLWSIYYNTMDTSDKTH